MSKKITLGISLFMFSAVALDLHTFLPEKVAEIKQKEKSSGEKLTLKDVLNYTAKVAVIVACAGVIVGCWRFIRNYEMQTTQLHALNNEIIPDIRKAVDNQTRTVLVLEGIFRDISLQLQRQEGFLDFIARRLVVKRSPTKTNVGAKPGVDETVGIPKSTMEKIDNK